MFTNLILNESIPPEQIKWISKFEPILRLAQNYQEEHFNHLLDQIKKEAKANGYKEILELM